MEAIYNIQVNQKNFQIKNQCHWFTGLIVSFSILKDTSQIKIRKIFMKCRLFLLGLLFFNLSASASTDTNLSNLLDKVGKKFTKYGLTASLKKLSYEEKIDALHHGLNQILPASNFWIKKEACHNCPDTGGFDEVDKPVIYFYSDSDRNVKVDLTFNGHFTYTYPEYQNGWNLLVHGTNGESRNSMITPLGGSRKYSYIFWEGQTKLDQSNIFEEGFLVSKNNITNFLSEKLELLGLNNRESDDFITYWAPKMTSFQRYAVRFVIDDDYDKFAKISIEPEPDSMRRVLMVFKGLTHNDSIEPAEQRINNFERKGFTVIEWGGCELN